MTFNKNRALTFSIIIRSLAFNLLFYFIVVVAVLFFLAPLSFCKSPAPMRKAILNTIELLIWLYDKIADVKIIETGIENIPVNKGFIYCSKHMSNMDALFLYRRSPKLTALAKKELFKVPLLNLVFKKMGVLSINRGASEAQKQTPLIAQILIDRKLPMIIFAEGTRTIVGERRELKSGVYYYQKEADLDIVVVSHNSGVSWPKNSWIKWPGTLNVEYHPALPKELEKGEFMERVEKALLDRSEELMLLE